MTQKEFSAWLNVSLNTVQAWEQGTRKPSHSALRLLEVLEKDFSFIKRVLSNKAISKDYDSKININLVMNEKSNHKRKSK